ncbi:hypothetical protein RF11_14047 [Thelohanellus kitauei]|uniref:Uncharacterized protein n=1 Tax=Thelohanellus kitauei TaxID=669202 RepID=A0A0C2N273_THEKT|nr:hypothetical protein RF11_14047 [Thelohanellus kitauei]
MNVNYEVCSMYSHSLKLGPQTPVCKHLQLLLSNFLPNIQRRYQAVKYRNCHKSEHALIRRHQLAQYPTQKLKTLRIYTYKVKFLPFAKSILNQLEETENA